MRALLLVALTANAQVAPGPLPELLAANRFVEAEEILRARLEDRPSDLESLRKLALLLFSNAFWDRALLAIQDWRRADPENPQPRIYYGAVLSALNRIEEAESEYRNLLTGPHSKVPELRLGYAQLLHASGRFDPALEHLDIALTTLPASSKLHFWRARVLFDAGNPREALAAARRAVALDPARPQARVLLLKIATRLGDRDEAARQAAWLGEDEKRRNR